MVKNFFLFVCFFIFTFKHLEHYKIVHSEVDIKTYNIYIKKEKLKILQKKRMQVSTRIIKT